MKKVTLLTFMLLAVSLLLSAQSVTNSAGTTLSNDDIIIEYSIGEPVISTLIGAQGIVTQGLLQPTYQIESQVNELFDEQYSFDCYPNPVAQQLYVETDFLDFQEFQVIDTKGQVIYTAPFNYQPINLSELPSGSYFIRFYSNQNLIKSYKTDKDMKSYITLIICLSLGSSLWAQAPQGINYQAVARNLEGQVLSEQNVNVEFNILNESPNGSVIYSESHLAQTNLLGLFQLTIGGGDVIAGNFSSIDWSDGQKFLRVTIDGNLQGTTPLLSVPYALYAAQADMQAGTGISVNGNIITNEGDLSETNEIQNLSLSGNTLSITEGNSVSLPEGADYTSGQGISIVNDVISNTGDLSETNEIQNLSLSGNTLSITEGNSVSLPEGADYTSGQGISIVNDVISNTGDLSETNEIQNLSLSGNTLSITEGNSVSLPEGADYIPGQGISIVNDVISNTGDLSQTNEIQSLSLSGNTLSITESNSVSLPEATDYAPGQGISIVNDVISNTGDLSQTNELQSLSLFGNTLSISNGNSVSLPTTGGGGNPVAPTYTTAQLLNTNNLPTGSIVFNSDDNALYYYSGTNWYKVNATLLNNPGSFVVTDCLLAYYNFDDGTGADVVEDFDGINDGCVFTADVNTSINSGQSATFDGMDRITVATNPLFNLSQGSISFWYKGFSGGTVIFGNVINSSAFRIRMFSNQGEKLIQYNTGQTFSYDLTDFLDNTWHHFVIAISSTQRNLYVDGMLRESITQNGGMTGTNQNSGMLIGQWDSFDSFSLSGKLDNLRIHCKALTADEVNQIFNAGQ